MAENKFLIKTTILETIETLAQLSANEFDLAQEILGELKKITDKNTVFKLIMNEYCKETAEYRQQVIGFILTQVFETEALKDLLWKMLKSRHYNDEIQNKLVFLIKTLGEVVNYEDYIQYFNDPDKIIDKDTEKLIDNATFNPESHIDFLDFIHTLNDSDWELMMNSLSEDFKGDNLANIFVPLIYLNLQNEQKLNFLIDTVTATSSSLLIKPLENVVKYSLSQSCVKNAKKNLSILKLKGKRISQAEEFYKKALANSEFFEAYTSYLDGHGNQCVIVVRKANNNTYQYFSAVVRDTKEIIDCFGFYELSQAEYQRIIKKFVSSQRLIKIHENIALTFLNVAEQYSLENNLAIPYEYFCWKNLLANSLPPIDLEKKLQEGINPNYQKFELNENSLEYFETWFFDENDDFFKKSIDILIPSIQMANTINNFLDILSKNYNQFEIAKKIKFRLLIMSTLMSLCGNKNLISIVAVLNNPESYTKLETFMLKHSIYEYFLREQENSTSSTVTNIFNKKTEELKHKFNDAQIAEAISYIEANW